MEKLKESFKVVRRAFVDLWRYKRPPVIYLIILVWFMFLVFFFRSTGVFAVWRDLERDLALFAVVRDPFPWYLLAQLLQVASLVMTVVTFAAGVYFCQNQYFIQLREQTEDLILRKQAGESDGQIKATQLLETCLTLLPLAGLGFLLGDLFAGFTQWQLHQYLVLQDALNAYRHRPILEIVLLLGAVLLILLVDHFSGRKLLMVITERQQVIDHK